MSRSNLVGMSLLMVQQLVTLSTGMKVKALISPSPKREHQSELTSKSSASPEERHTASELFLLTTRALAQYQTKCA